METQPTYESKRLNRLIAKMSNPSGKFGIIKILELFSTETDKCMNSVNFVRSERRQRKSLRRLEALLEFIVKVKYEFINKQIDICSKEDISNLLLQMQCRINFFISELKMTLKLKDGDPESAWSFLVDAQEYLCMSEKIGAIERIQFGKMTLPIKSKEMSIHKERIKAIEKHIFPMFRFNSLGLLYKGGDCSICNERYTKCEHQDGMFYCGQFCFIINRTDLKIDHNSFVESPKDKRCIVREFDTKGKRRNVMTWESVPSQKTTEDSDQFLVSSIAYAFRRIDIR